MSPLPTHGESMYRIVARFLEWGEQMPGHWFRWGKNYATQRRAMQAKADMLKAWPDMKLRIIHHYAPL